MSTDAERNAVEKMKLAAMQGIPGPPIETDPTLAPAEPIDLPPHQRILTLTMDSTPVERIAKQKIPAAQLARIVFKLSTGEDGEPCELSVGEARVLLAQLTHLNQVIESWQRAAAQAEDCLQSIKSGGVAQHQVVSALAALKQARQ